MVLPALAWLIGSQGWRTAAIVVGIGVVFFAHGTWSGILILGVPVEIVLRAMIYGLGYGASIPLAPALQGDFCGRKAFASISGLMTPFTMIGTVAGPVFAGFIYDSTQNYYQAFMVFAVSFMFSGIAFLLLKRPQKRAAVRLA